MVISNHNSFRVCLIKLLPYISFEKYINILALEMASPGNQHCANCIGAPSVPILCFPIPERHIISTLQTIQCHFPTGGGVKSNIEFSVYRVGWQYMQRMFATLRNFRIRMVHQV